MAKLYVVAEQDTIESAVKALDATAMPRIRLAADRVALDATSHMQAAAQQRFESALDEFKIANAEVMALAQAIAPREQLSAARTKARNRFEAMDMANTELERPRAQHAQLLVVLAKGVLRASSDATPFLTDAIISARRELGVRTDTERLHRTFRNMAQDAQAATEGMEKAYRDAVDKATRIPAKTSGPVSQGAPPQAARTSDARYRVYGIVGESSVALCDPESAAASGRGRSTVTRGYQRQTHGVGAQSSTRVVP